MEIKKINDIIPPSPHTHTLSPSLLGLRADYVG